MEWGVAGASVGTIFIACEESDVSMDYKQAMNANTVRKTSFLPTKLSGSHLTVINTPYVHKDRHDRRMARGIDVA